jgi:hypothetical protein
MGGKELLLGIFTILFLTSATMLVFGDDVEKNIVENPIINAGDPLIQGEGHDHKNASQHELGTDNMELLDFNPLTTPGMPRCKWPPRQTVKHTPTLLDGTTCTSWM